MLLGKFMPPHRGHQYMIDFARRCVDDLTVLVCSLPGDPIPGRLRYEWMRDHFGGVNVVHCEEVVPQTPEDDPEHFWDIWRELVLRYTPCRPDVVFASEAYGVRLAQELRAQFMPVDPAREVVPVSATLIRSDPQRYFEYLLPEARPYFTRRVVLVGPESSGKSTLTKWLAQRFCTPFVAEYGRTFQENVGRDLRLEDMLVIAAAHQAAEDAISIQGKGLIFVDTEAIITKAWCRVFFKAVPEGLESLIRPNRYALYFLTEPHSHEWHDDGWRLQPDRADRMRFCHEVRAELEAYGCPYLVLSGDWEDRQRQAEAAVNRLWVDSSPSERALG
jgi:NadR type nicotinamide-nucleotide adenylyltransferase